MIATILTGAGALLGAWRELGSRISEVEMKLGARIDAVNTRMDNILLADRTT